MVCVGSVQVFRLEQPVGPVRQGGHVPGPNCWESQESNRYRNLYLIYYRLDIDIPYVITHALFFNYFYSRSFLFLGILPTIGELMRVRSMSKF